MTDNERVIAMKYGFPLFAKKEDFCFLNSTTNEIFSGKDQWLISEFLATQPKQFLYSLTATIIGQETLKSYASF
ncbi:MAG: hypothetical protein GQ582_03095 [Methyloprofundus sp.]|nr:hypothetical protein [Methyloprofundus sp.]